MRASAWRTQVGSAISTRIEVRRGLLGRIGGAGIRDRLGAISGSDASGYVRAGAWQFLNYGLPILIIFVPVASFLVHSIYYIDEFEIIRSPTLVNFVRLFSEEIYVPLFFKTCGLALQVAALCLLIGYPVAYFLASLHGRAKHVATLLFVVPLFMSYIIKIFAIRGILGRTGFLNHTLIFLGVLDEPTDLFVFNFTAVKATLTMTILPFTILPIFVSLEKIPKTLLEASGDLGARSWHTFRRVILPLSLPGTVVGVTFAFVLAVGDFIAPQMVGGVAGFTYGFAVYRQFGVGFNWPFGAALAVFLLIVVLLAMVFAARLGRAKAET